MNEDTRKVWEDRFRAGGAVGEPEPSVLEMIPLLPREIALDLAAGMGRNAIALARAGIPVVAADFSAVAMRALRETALTQALPITPVVANLEAAFPFRPRSFTTIVNVNFLSRDLIPRLKDSLRPGGMLLFDTFIIDQAASGHPRDPRFLLQHYELRELLTGMELLRYREGLTVYPDGKQSWRAAALARRRS
ncbi:MAG: class I SAM-dependent methyltransferase [Candidatus Binataceae bacterium]